MSMTPLMASISPTAARSRVGTSWIAASGKPAARSPSTQGCHQRPRGMEALRAAAQDRGIAGFERQPAGIGGDVGTALIDDADDAERHRDTLDQRAHSAASGGRARGRPGRAGRRSSSRPAAIASSRFGSSARRSRSAGVRDSASARSRALAARISFCAAAHRPGGPASRPRSSPRRRRGRGRRRPRGHGGRSQPSLAAKSRGGFSRQVSRHRTSVITRSSR